MSQNNSSYESILKEASKQGSSPLKISKTYPAYLVLIVMLVISYFVWNQAKEQVQNDRKTEFDKAVSSVMSRLESQYQRNEEIILSMSGLYDILTEVVRDYFDLYGQIPTKTYPSILSIDYVAYVKNSELGVFTFNAMSSGYYDYKIKNDLNTDYFYPILHSVPIGFNYHRLGTDFAKNPVIKASIEKARDKNEIVSTPVLSFRDDTTGFLLISPIYVKDQPRNSLSQRRNNFQGCVIIELESTKYFENAIASGNKDGTSSNSFPTDSTIVFQIVDTSANGESIVFESNNSHLLRNEYDKYVTSSVYYNIADRNFKINFATVPGFGGSFQQTMPTVALIASLILSLLFFGFVLSVTTSRARAIDLADRMTRSQRRIVDSSKDIIAVLDYAGIWKSMNPASVDIFGVSPDSLIGNNIEPLFYSKEDKSHFETILKNAYDESSERIDIRMKNSEGDLRWVNWNFTFAVKDQLIYSIGRDVTLEKIAEEESILRTKQIQLAEQFAREASESKSYFMTKLAHMMRNSLTGMMGYLQLLTNKIYETEEEHDTYLQLAEASTEEIFSFVSDIVEAAIGADSQSSEFEFVHVNDLFKEVFVNVHKVNAKTITINELESNFNAKAVADKNILKDVIVTSMNALLLEVKSGSIQVQASENSHEGATEIQILMPSSKLSHKMVSLYKDIPDAINAIKFDEKDVILTLAKSASDVRRMNGNFVIESFGETDSLLLQITMPLNKTKED